MLATGLLAAACASTQVTTAQAPEEQPPASSTTAPAIPTSTLPVATSTSTSSTTSTTSTSIPPDERPVPVTDLPAGFTLVSPAPADTVRVGQSWEYGTWTGLDMTPTTAVVAFTHVVDPATGTTALLTSRWETDTGTWSGASELHRGRLSSTLAGTWPVATASTAPLVAAAAPVADDAEPDPARMIGIVHESQDEQGHTRGITLRVSDDDGRSWRAETVTGEAASAPSAAIHEGVAAVGYWQDGSLVVATKDLTADGDWRPVIVPMLPGTMPAGAGPVVAIDRDGRIGVAALVDATAGSARRVVWWDGRSATPVVVGQLPPTTDPTPVPVAVAFDGTNPVVAIGDGTLAHDGTTTAALAVVRSTDGGASFGAPAPVAADGPAARPLAISLATTGAATSTPAPWALTFVPDTTDRGDCGLPKLAVGTSPSSWDACLENGPSRRVVATGLASAVAYDAAGRLNLTVTVAASDGRLEPGVYLWRAPVG